MTVISIDSNRMVKRIVTFTKTPESSPCYYVPYNAYIVSEAASASHFSSPKWNRGLKERIAYVPFHNMFVHIFLNLLRNADEKYMNIFIFISYIWIHCRRCIRVAAYRFYSKLYIEEYIMCLTFPT